MPTKIQKKKKKKKKHFLKAEIWHLPIDYFNFCLVRTQLIRMFIYNKFKNDANPLKKKKEKEAKMIFSFLIWGDVWLSKFIWQVFC